MTSSVDLLILTPYNVTSLTPIVAGWSSLVARRAHNPKVVGSNPAPATNFFQNSMFTHFTFGNLKHDPALQIQKFIDLILLPQKLKFCSCVEFLIANNSSGFKVPLERATKVNNEISVPIKLDDLIYSPKSIAFLPQNIFMICFIKSSENKLRKNVHLKEYGNLGIALTDDFIKKNYAEEVQYYKHFKIVNEPIVIEWQKLASKTDRTTAEGERIQHLVRKITAFRKPEKMFKEFQEKIVLMTNDNLEIKSIYDRYPLGYDFRNEFEWRIISDTEKYLSFKTENIVKIFTANEPQKVAIQNALSKKWEKIPPIEVLK